MKPPLNRRTRETTVARDRLLKQHLRERFIVTMATGETFSGLLDEHDDRHVTLVDAHALVESAQPVSVAGKLFLPRDGISYMQRPAS